MIFFNFDKNQVLFHNFRVLDDVQPGSGGPYNPKEVIILYNVVTVSKVGVQCL